MSDIVERLRKRGWGSNVTDTLNRWDSERTEAAAEITRLQAELAEARDKALDEAAGIADNAYAEHEQSGLTHPEDSDSRSRCFARARSAMYIAEAIRALKSPKPPIL